MADMEKVIAGLKCIKGDLVLCVDCAYSDSNGHGTYSCKAFCVNDAIVLLKEQPQIVRCKDCKHRYNDNECPYCNECGGRAFPADDWFCADGELS